MSWATILCALYDANARRAGEVEMWNGKPLMLIPVGFDTMEAQIEITIDVNGNFVNARSLNKSEAETLVPYPEGRTSGEKALPLFDKLIYIAGDYNTYVPDEKEKSTICHKLYMEGLTAWCESQYSFKAAQAVFRYVSHNCMITDLVHSNVILVDSTGELDKAAKIQSIAQSDAFVRFRVFSGEMTDLMNESRTSTSYESAIWLNKLMHERFLQYYMSSTDAKELCYISGIYMRPAKMSPTKIRNKGDQTKLISSNDSQNYTYRGRFNTKDKDTGYNEAMSIGYESSQKAINALKWIIRRQGYRRDGVCVVTWECDLRDLPQYYDGTPAIIGALSREDEDAISYNNTLFDEPGVDNSDTNYATAKEFMSAIDGYSTTISDVSNMVVLALDSASQKGRLALAYYKELSSSRYLKNMRSWQESCCWRHGYFRDKKYCRYEGMASIKEIAMAVYGAEQDKRLLLHSNSDGKCPMLISAFDRLRPCIIDGAVIPQDMVKMAVQKASNPVAYKNWSNYQSVLHIACSLVKKQYWDKGVIFDMNLDEKCTDRSYLFGRLIAVAEKVERCTYEKGEARTTNAERYMQQFSRTPMRTWEIIRRNTQIYLKQLKPGSREHYKNLYGAICALFEEGAFESKDVLNGKYLIGYDCQREALKYRKNDNINMDSDDNESENTNKEEN